jgi:hypothetical protein
VLAVFNVITIAIRSGQPAVIVVNTCVYSPFALCELDIVRLLGPFLPLSPITFQFLFIEYMWECIH